MQMVTRIIERSRENVTSPLNLERVSVTPEVRTESDHPDASALASRISQLEHALVQTEAAAYAKGRRDVELALQERVDASLKATAERLAKSLNDLALARPKVCRQAEVDLLRLAIAIAHRILHRELSIDPIALQSLVQVCLDRIGRQEQLSVRVNPGLVAPVRTILAKLSSRDIDVAADNNLEAGALIFETTRGQLDASIQTQLDEIERGLIDRLEEQP